MRPHTSVGDNHALISAPRRFHLNMRVHGEGVLQPCLLFLSEQPGFGMQGPAGFAERVPDTSAMAVRLLLNPAPARIECVPCQADDNMVGIHDRHVHDGPAPSERGPAAPLSSYGWQAG